MCTINKQSRPTKNVDSGTLKVLGIFRGFSWVFLLKIVFLDFTEINLFIYLTALKNG